MMGRGQGQKEGGPGGGLKIKMPPTCEAEGCATRASYGLPGEKARWCAKHKDEGALDLGARRCEAGGCATRASYGLPGEKARWCAKHKDEGALDLGARRCEAGGCATRASYGLPGEKARWCAKHKDEGALLLTARRCLHLDCASRATQKNGYGAAISCSRHAKAMGIELNSEPRSNAPVRCMIPGCFTLGCFADRTRLLCEKHHGALPAASRALFFPCVRSCPVAGCFGSAQPELGGLCYPCARAQGLDVPRLTRRCAACDLFEFAGMANAYLCPSCKANVNRREIAYVLRLAPDLRRAGVRLPLVYNEPGDPGCTAARPDVHFFTKGAAVVLEIDEGQHRSREESCECARMAGIVSDLASRAGLDSHYPVVFVRFNPDGYRVGKVRASTPGQDRYACLLSLLVALATSSSLSPFGSPLELDAFPRACVAQLYYDRPAGSAPIQWMDLAPIFS
jgi:hypothetical protein